MTGYLAALATREFGASSVPGRLGSETALPAIKPRRVTAYAPPPMAVESDVPSIRAGDMRPVTRTDEERADNEIGVRSARIETAQTSFTPVPAALERAHAKHTHESDVGDTMEPGDLSTSVTPVTPSARIARSPIPRRDETPLRADRTEATPNRVEPISPIARATHGDGTPRSLAAPEEHRTTRSTVVPAIPPAPGAPLPIVSPRRPVAEIDMRIHERATPRDESPSVVVTIGRIEVRAISAPAAPPPVRNARPTMSLEDYLSQRSRGLR